MNAEACDRSATPIEKDVLGWRPPCDPYGKLARRVWPQRTPALLIALAPESYKGVIPLRRVGKVEAANPELGCFISAGSGVVQEQQ
jgi:hypothetical protein